MPSLPLVLFSAVLASLYAAFFHLLKGKTILELPIFWAASLLGFVTGQLAAYFLKFHLLMIGELHFVEASLASVTFLFIVRWLKL